MTSDKPRESCGLFGVYGAGSETSRLIYHGLFSLQHRGQEGAGMAVSDGLGITQSRGVGLVSEVFPGDSVGSIHGVLGIGHTRYSTTGSAKLENVQPLVVECVDGDWAIAHNGNLTNAATLRGMYQEAGAIFQTSTDSEVLIHLLADPLYRNRPQRVARALSELRGAFAFLLMTRNCVMAARDPSGFRPLSIGKLGEAIVFASETCALAQVGATFVRDVEPGELVIVDEAGIRSESFAERRKPLKQCVFEMVYFARPDSIVFGRSVHQTRLHYGMRLAEEHPADADIVISVPDSGNSAALGYSRASGIPLDFGFIRNHYIGRTFIMPQASDRASGVDIKLAILPEVVRGRRVVVVDDSIVRGTTARRRVAALRHAGAVEVHMRVSCPPTAHPCFYGVDFPTREELIAGSKTVEQIRKYLEADSLGYLSREGLLSPYDNPEDFCSACFTGDYGCEKEPAHEKDAFERWRHELRLDESAEVGHLER